MVDLVIPMAKIEENQIQRTNFGLNMPVIATDKDEESK